MTVFKFKVTFEIEKNTNLAPDSTVGKYRVIMKYENATNPILNGSMLRMTQYTNETDVQFLNSVLTMTKQKNLITNIVRGETIRKMTEAGMFEGESPEALELIKQIEEFTYENLEITI